MIRTPVIEPLESRRLLAATPVAPLALDEPLDYFGAGPSTAALGGTVFFVVPGASTVREAELWKNDGTSSTLVARFTDNTFLSYRVPVATNLTAANGFLYFTVFRDSGTEIWRSDGSPGGTIKLTTLGRPTVEVTYRPYFTVFAGDVYFSAPNAGGLWKNAPASTTATRVSGGSQLLVNGGALYSTLGDGIYRTEANGTATRIAAVTPLSNVVSAGGTLFFLARGGSGNVTSLYKSDGTAAHTEVVAQVAISFTTPITITAAGGTVYFEGYDATHGYELWKSDGTASGTGIVADIRPGASDSSPWQMVAFGDSLYFAASDSSTSAVKLWQTRGTADTTVPVMDFAGGRGSGVRSVAVVGGQLYVTARTPDLGTELWRGDGTAGGMQLFKDVYPGRGSSRPHEIIDAAGAVHFLAIDPGAGYALLRIDGDTTTLVKDYRAGALNLPTNRPLSAAFLPDGRLVYSDGDGTSTGRELYVTDGTPAAAALLKDIHPTPWTGSATDYHYLTNSNGTIFFAADVTTTTIKTGVELWKTDGTPEGTVLVKDINLPTDSFDREFSSNPHGFIYFNGLTYFFADDEVHGEELWRSDGTEAGTFMVADSRPGDSSSNWGRGIVVGDTLYFVSLSGVGRLNPTTGRPVGLQGFASASVGDPTPFKGMLFFSGRSEANGIPGTNGTELWRSDGTTKGTVMVKDIWRATSPTSYNSSNPYYFEELNGELLFSANDGLHGAELWKTDGTDAGTAMVKDIVPGNGNSSPLQLQRFKGAVYFTATDGVNGYGLWRTDGTAAGTTAVKSFSRTLRPSAPVSAGGSLYFIVEDDARGREIWVSDGTPDGTRLYADLNPGAAGSDPGSLVVHRGALWFTANDGTGPRVFKIDDTAAPVLGTALPFTHHAALYLNFSETLGAVPSVASAQLIDLASGRVIDADKLRLELDPAGDRLVLTAPGFPNGVLPDGDYRLRIAASAIVDQAGNRPAEDLVVDFFVLAADANHDRTVDFNDLTVLAQLQHRRTDLRRRRFQLRRQGRLQRPGDPRPAVQHDSRRPAAARVCGPFDRAAAAQGRRGLLHHAGRRADRGQTGSRGARAARR